MKVRNVVARAGKSSCIITKRDRSKKKSKKAAFVDLRISVPFTLDDRIKDDDKHEDDDRDRV